MYYGRRREFGVNENVKMTHGIQDLGAHNGRRSRSVIEKTSPSIDPINQNQQENDITMIPRLQNSSKISTTG
jgi:hypothetical protein